MAKGIDLKSWPREMLEEQLRLCWEQFRRCLSVLHGEKVNPVTLASNAELGDSDDLELFYECKLKGDKNGKGKE